jgi:arginine exporter protein ArgO
MWEITAMGVTNLGLFLIASIALILAPGPDSLYELARGLGQGRRAGLIAALGTTSGLLVHTTLAALGLAVLLQTSEIAYTVVRVGGALYLIYLGVRALLSRERLALFATASSSSPWRMYLQGLFTNVLNRSPEITALCRSIERIWFLLQRGQVHLRHQTQASARLSTDVLPLRRTAGELA